MKEKLMNLLLNSHENGCTPFVRCRSCVVVDFLEEKLPKSAFTEFSELYVRDGVDFGAHNDGCTPLRPCSNCKARDLLKTKLGKDNASGQDLFEAFIHLYTSPIPLDLNASLLMSLDELNLSARTTICLRNANLLRVGDVVIQSEAELLRVPNFGRKALNEIKEVLSSLGLRLGMDIPGWPPEA